MSSGLRRATELRRRLDRHGAGAGGVSIMHETARGYPWCIDDHGHVMLAPTEDPMDMVWLELADIEAMLLAITGQRQMAISEAAKEAAVDIWLAEWESRLFCCPWGLKDDDETVGEC